MRRLALGNSPRQICREEFLSLRTVLIKTREYYYEYSSEYTEYYSQIPVYDMARSDAEKVTLRRFL